MTQDQYEPSTLAAALADELMRTLNDAIQDMQGNGAEAALARGKIFQLSGHHEAAIASYQSAAARDVRLDEARARLALVQGRAGQHDNALATAMALAQCNPGFGFKELSSSQVMTSMTLLGDMLVLNQRIHEATEAYQVAVDHYKSDAFAAGRLAQMLMLGGDLQQGLEHLPGLSANPGVESIGERLTPGRGVPASLARLSSDELQSMVAMRPMGGRW